MIVIKRQEDIMELKFKQTSEQHIDIIAFDKDEEKIVGRIFTPSSSANNIKNAIQICGFTEAFDLWGCSEFQHLRETRGIGNDIIKRDSKGNPIMQQAKDIQLQFTWETRRTPQDYSMTEKLFDNCCYCFNNPCTCEVQIKGENPYTVKREQDISCLKVEDKKSSPIQHSEVQSQSEPYCKATVKTLDLTVDSNEDSIKKELDKDYD
jgi:hypothetical protein